MLLVSMLCVMSLISARRSLGASGAGFAVGGGDLRGAALKIRGHAVMHDARAQAELNAQVEARDVLV